jgi:hypothetical protein
VDGDKGDGDAQHDEQAGHVGLPGGGTETVKKKKKKKGV